MLLVSCSRKGYIPYGNYSFKSKDTIPDYSNLYNWASHPWKWDPGDSIPKSIKDKNLQPDSLADVFFIHPTTLTDFSDERWNATIDDSVLNIKTDYSTILYQASAFNEQCRVFAPRYRQAHLKVFYDGNIQKDSAALETAYKDVRNAFEYYLTHYNNNRPFIIASHSQGTVHAGRLLKEFVEGKELQSKFICAYIIGMPIPENYFSILRPCKDSLETGCFTGWRTFKRDYTDTAFVSKEAFKSVVTNPLTWKLTEEYAPSVLNTGGVLKNFDKTVKGVVDAQIHGNILWTCKPKFFGNIFLVQKNYHVGDINLFYINIRSNVKSRLRSFLSKKS